MTVDIVAGVVQELRGEVDDTSNVGDVIATVGEGEPSGDGRDEDSGDEQEAADHFTQAEGDQGQGPEQPDAAGEGEDRDEQLERETQQTHALPRTSAGGDASGGEGMLTSPAGAQAAAGGGHEAGQVQGTGPGGRITRADAEHAIEEGPQEQPAEREAAASLQQAEQPQATGAGVTPPPAAPTGVPDRPTAGTKQIEFSGDPQDHRTDQPRAPRHRQRHEELVGHLGAVDGGRRDRHDAGDEPAGRGQASSRTAKVCHCRHCRSPCAPWS